MKASRVAPLLKFEKIVVYPLIAGWGRWTQMVPLALMSIDVNWSSSKKNACLIVLRISHIHRPQKKWLTKGVELQQVRTEHVTCENLTKTGSNWLVMHNSLGFKPSHIANDSPCGVSDTAHRGVTVNVLKFKVRSTLSTKTSVNPNKPTGTCWNSLQLTIPERTWSTNELVTQIPSKDCNCWSKKSFPHIKLLAFRKSDFRSLRLVWILKWGKCLHRAPNSLLDVYRHPT